MQQSLLTKRLATIAAALGFAAGVAAPFRVFHVFVANTGSGPGTLGLWMVVPIALGALAIAAVRTESIGFVWVSVGAVWGFVILGAWSLGTFFAWEALALLAAGLIHLVGIGPRWKLLLVPLWLIAGACGLSVLFLVRDIAQTGPGEFVDHAPAVMFGSWISAAAVTLLGAAYATPMVWGGRRARSVWKTVALTIVLVTLLLVASRLAQQGLRALAILGARQP